MLLLLPLILNSVGVLAWEPELRIVGGEPVAITDRPFQVLIYRLIYASAIPDCGGAIISHRWVLTAAHCVHLVPAEHMIIRAGSDNLDDENSWWYKIAWVIPHKEFQYVIGTTSHDIALLMTQEEIELGPNIWPIRLRTKSPEPSTEAVVSGFGVTQEGGPVMSKVLKEVSVTVLDRDNCRKLLANISEKLSLSDTHFCAAYLEGGRDACQGDSGGPITIGYSLAGIVSWGVGCAQKMVPAFYTDVSLFIPWIDENITKYSERKQKKSKFNLSNKKKNWYAL